MINALKWRLFSGHVTQPSEVTCEKELDPRSLKRWSLSKVALAVMVMLVVLGAVTLGSGFAGAKLMVRYQYDATCCQLSAPRSAFVSIKEKLGLVTFHSQMGQDKWVSEGVFPGVRDGFFVDVGSADGTWMSNTKALEERGWTGICIDAFPRKMEGRICHVVKAVVFSESGKRIQFLSAGGWGGIIDDTFGISKDREPGAPIVEFTTVTLGEILERAKAPRFIHYMSMDIEGGEVHALKGFPFDKYQLGALTVEHNFIEPKRSEIKALMEAHGYKRFWTSVRDDFYLPANP